MPTTYPSPNALVTTTVTAGISTQVATANLQRVGLYVFNPSPTLTLWVSPTGTPAVANGSGCVAVQPLQGVMFGPPNTPAWNNGMNATTSTSSQLITILEYYNSGS